MKYLAKNILAEEYNSFKYSSLYVDDVTNYVKKNVLYDIEINYLESKIDYKDYRIYDVIKLDSGIKYVYVKDNDSLCFDVVVIPKLDIVYTIKKHFQNKILYLWKDKNGKLIRRYSLGRIYNRNNHRYYEVGDYNLYGWKIIKISHVVVNDYNLRVPTYVCLKF